MRTTKWKSSQLEGTLWFLDCMDRHILDEFLRNGANRNKEMGLLPIAPRRKIGIEQNIFRRVTAGALWQLVLLGNTRQLCLI